MIKLMYITNDIDVAKIAEDSNVDRIFIDLEYIGKSDRQGGMDTVQNRHTINDIKNVKKVINKSELLVRCNPIHSATSEYNSSEDEISQIIESGADIIMLPYFKTKDEVEKFINIVDKKCRTMLLIETPEAVEKIDEILSVKGIDEVLIGLNDLSLGYGMKFMFELLANGIVDNLCKKFKQKNIPYGFGGLASLDGGLLPGKYILAEHYRLGSTCVILSRSFCNVNKNSDFRKVKNIFEIGVKEIRDYERNVIPNISLENNKNKIIELIKEIREKL